MGGAYGESMLSGQRTETVQEDGGEGLGLSNGTSRRTRTSGGSNGWTQPRNHIEGYNSIDEMDDEPDAASSGDDYDAADGEDNFGDEDEEMSEGQSMDEEDMDIRPSLVVQLRYGKGNQAAKQESYPSPPAAIKSEAMTEEKPQPAPPSVPQPPTIESQPTPIERRPQTPPLNGSAPEPATKTEQLLMPQNTRIYAKDQDQLVDHVSKPSSGADVIPLQQTPVTQPAFDHNDSGVL